MAEHESDLFRSAAIQHRYSAKPESLFITTTSASKLIAIAAALVCVSLIFLTAFARVPVGMTVRGVVVSASKASRITSPIDGRVDRLLVDVGSFVRRGQPIMRLTSGEVGKARLLEITAPDTGLVSELDVEQDAPVAETGVVAIVVPTDVHLSGIILVPGNGVDFLHRGLKLKVRMDDFPSAQYGAITATVASVAGVAANAQERAEIGIPEGIRETYYRASVAFEQTQVLADGALRNLHTGMSFSTNFARTSRPIWKFLAGEPQRGPKLGGSAKQ